MSIDVKSIIGNLLLQASTNKIVSKVLTAYEHTAKQTANHRALNSFNVDLLEETAQFFDIELADTSGLKLYTKDTLINRIILAIRAHFPSICGECSEEYVNEFDGTEEPFFTCFMCFLRVSLYSLFVLMCFLRVIQRCSHLIYVPFLKILVLLQMLF